MFSKPLPVFYHDISPSRPPIWQLAVDCLQRWRAGAQPASSGRYVAGRLESQGKELLVDMWSSDAELPYRRRVRVKTLADAERALTSFCVMVITDSGEPCDERALRV